MILYTSIKLSGVLFWLCLVILWSQTLSSETSNEDTSAIASDLQPSASLDVSVPNQLSYDNRALSQGQESEDKTLLEEWIENLQLKVIHSIPHSDSECLFMWRNISCEPSYRCRLKYQFGDYSPNRACRLRTGNETTFNLPMLKQFAGASKVVAKSISLVRGQWGKVVEKVKQQSPPSDDLCSWSLKKLSCIPSKYCSLNYRLGDYSLNRACRLKEDEDFAADN